MSQYDILSSNDEEYTEKSKPFSRQASNTSTRRDDDQGNWLSKKDSAKTKKPSIVVDLRDTKLKKVDSSKLIWAKCHFFKGGPFCPARIAEIGEATCQKDIPTLIPPKFELVEFICLPLKNPIVPRFVVCKKSETVAFDSALNGRKQLTMRSYSSNGVVDVDELNWDAGRMDTLRQKLKEKYDIDSSNTVISKIKRMAREFLRNVTDHSKQTGSPEYSRGRGRGRGGGGRRHNDSDDDNCDSPSPAPKTQNRPERSPEEAPIPDLFSQVFRRSSSKMPQIITAGRWISFQHKIFTDRTTYVRVIEVTGTPREPVLLENDDVLRPTDLVCLLDELPSDAEHSEEYYSQDTVEVLNSRKGSDSKNVLVSGKGGYVKGSGKATPLGDFIFEKGKINCMSLQDEVQQSVRSIKASPKKSSSPKSPTKPRKNVRDRNSSSTSSSSGVKNGINTKKTEEKRSVRDIMMVRYSDDEEEDRKSSFRGSARDSTKSDTTSDARSGVKRFVNRDDIIAVDRDIHLKSIRHENHVDLCRSSDDSDEPIADMIAKRKKYAEKKDNDSWESYSPERRNEI